MAVAASIPIDPFDEAKPARTAVHAEEFGTAEEARAMRDRAIAALNANQARALSEFNNTKNTQFHDRDL